MLKRSLQSVVTVLSVAICLFTIVAVNYTLLQPQSALAIFVMLGMTLCFLTYPAAKRVTFPEGTPTDENRDPWNRQRTIWMIDRIVGIALAVASVICFAYVFVQTEPWDFFRENFWTDGVSLGNRSGNETTLDYWIGGIGLILVLEATRRCIGWIVPALAGVFVLHAFVAPHLPDWLLAHQGCSVDQIISATFLQSTGVLGKAAGVMFQFVFLFVLFGAFLEMSGATQFVIDFSERVLGSTPGGPAKVSVLGSGLMGSLSGSAVANAVTTGSFTIPMMRNAGFKSHVAAGITAAAASGGALVPPVMGAGAYMMLEFVERGPGQPQVTFLEIARAALIPAVLYYFSLFMIVHFYSQRIGVCSNDTEEAKKHRIFEFEALVFFGALGFLVALLLLGFTPFKAVTGSLVLILVLSALRPRLQMDRSARIFALATFFVIVVLHQLTGMLTDLPAIESGQLKNLLATSWYHPVEGSLEWRRTFDSILNSSFVGMLGLLVFGLIHSSWRPGMLKAMKRSAQNGIALVAASACVGIIIGVVQSTPMANDFGSAIKSVVEDSLFLALIGIMVCSLILGMGVPSVVCYLLMATLMGSMLGEMGVDPLAAHLFIFYFGMMSMVTPPVALASYASASIADAKIMPTSMASFRFSLVGFTLPFMFIYRPALLLMGEDGRLITWNDAGILAWSVIVAVLGIVSLAAGITGYLKTNLSSSMRGLAYAAAALMLIPRVEIADVRIGLWVNIVGILLFLAIAWINLQRNNGTSQPLAA